MSVPSYTVRENIPVSLSFYSLIKRTITNFFRRPIVVKILTFLPKCLFQDTVKLANLIIRCRTVFENCELFRSRMETDVYGGDKLATLGLFGERIDQVPRQNSLANRTLNLNFSKEDSLTAARRIRSNLNDPKEEIAILSFSNRSQKADSAFAPFGNSQEGFLARRSNLVYGTDYNSISSRLSCIREAEAYRPDTSLPHYIPYFGAIYSRGVTFIADADDVATPLNFDQFNIISAAAPDMRSGSDESIFFKNKNPKNPSATQYKVLEHKIQAIFNTAIIEGNRHLVLGAFGCGIHGNDTEEVAQVFKKVINQTRYLGRFENITFAIDCEEKKDIFERVFLNLEKSLPSDTKMTTIH